MAKPVIYGIQDEQKKACTTTSRKISLARLCRSVTKGIIMLQFTNGQVMLLFNVIKNKCFFFYASFTHCSYISSTKVYTTLFKRKKATNCVVDKAISFTDDLSSAPSEGSWSINRKM